MTEFHGHCFTLLDVFSSANCTCRNFRTEDVDEMMYCEIERGSL